MKNALILHGTDGSSRDNWFPWLKTELEKISWHVWTPDLPHSEKPNIVRYNEYIFSSGWKFDKDSVLIGHSSGAVAILGLLQDLPDDVCVEEVVLVGIFKNDLGWESLSELFQEPFNFEKIKLHAKKFVFIHSNDDPYCPLPGAKELSDKLSGELIVLPGQKHFSIGTAGDTYKEFPFLLKLLKTI